MKSAYAEIITSREFVESIKTNWAGQEILYLEETGSTNVEARLLAQQGKGHGTLVVAGRQTQGKGRRGRVWYSEEGDSIAMSMILKPDLEADSASMITLVQAMAVAKALEEVSALEVEIKWPNDILIKEKKVCGILTEMHLEEGRIASIVLGTGINVNQEDFPEEIAEIATSLKIEKKELQSPTDCIKRICELFEQYFELFLESKDLSAFTKEYNDRLISRARKVKVLDPCGEYEGEALGINALGELLVKKETAEVVSVYAGEVSVRGIYGYV